MKVLITYNSLHRESPVANKLGIKAQLSHEKRQ